VRWDFGPAVVDLEAPAYADAARPFTLRARAVVGPRGAEIVIPDVALRYQAPRGDAAPRSGAIRMPMPAVEVECGGVPLRVDGGPAARVLELTVPVAAPSRLVAQVTYATVLITVLYVLVSLLRF
jgi:hypothetical protein